MFSVSWDPVAVYRLVGVFRESLAHDSRAGHSLKMTKPRGENL